MSTTAIIVIMKMPTNMTQEQKELLLKDLCARLPYGVVIQEKCVEQDESFLPNKEGDRLVNIDSHADLLMTNCGSWYYLDEVKPYLFSLSSMTEEQKRELSNICKCLIHFTDWEIYFPNYEDNNMGNWQKIVSWMYKNHYDINGLIEKGLAIDASGLNIKIY